jgi:hypothetical protein
MEQELVAVLRHAIHPSNSTEVVQITDLINSLHGRPDVIEAYLCIIPSSIYEESVRLNACIQLRIDVESHWKAYDQRLQTFLSK